MTGNQGNLPMYCPTSSHDSSHIIVGNGNTLPILGTGTTSIKSSNARFILSNVLHAPQLIKNLISVCKFTKDNACSIEFDPNGFYVKDLHSRKEIMRSSSGGDLYSFRRQLLWHLPPPLQALICDTGVSCILAIKH